MICLVKRIGDSGWAIHYASIDLVHAVSATGSTEDLMTAVKHGRGESETRETHQSCRDWGDYTCRDSGLLPHDLLSF